MNIYYWSCTFLDQIFTINIYSIDPVMPFYNNEHKSQFCDLYLIILSRKKYRYMDIVEE